MNETIPLKKLNRMDGNQKLIVVLIVAALFAIAAIGICLVFTANHNAQKSEREFRACVQYHPPAECALAIDKTG